MRFERSMLQASRAWSPSRTLGSLKDAADKTPENLKSMIIHGGFHPLAAWINSEEGSLYDVNVESKMGLNETEYQKHFLDPDGAFVHLNPHAILTYGLNIGVHPAHMVPFDNDPRLSLQANLLLANVLILKDKDFTAEDKGLAQRAIISEKERFARFVQRRELNGFSAQEKQFDRDQVFRLVDEFIISQAGGFIEIVPQMPEKSPVAKNEMSVIEGSRNALTLLFEKAIVARDRKNQERRRFLQEANDDLKLEEKRVSDAYFKLFSGVIPDIGIAAGEFTKTMGGYTRLIPGDETSLKPVRLSQIRAVLMSTEKDSFARLHEAVRCGRVSMSEQDIELRVGELVKASADMIYASKFRLGAFKSYTVDKKCHAGDVEKIQYTQSRIETGELAYISRLVANQHIICCMDRSYRPHDSTSCSL